MIRELCQDPLIDCPGLGQAAGLVMPDGNSHRLINRELRHVTCESPVTASIPYRDRPGDENHSRVNPSITSQILTYFNPSPPYAAALRSACDR